MLSFTYMHVQLSLAHTCIWASTKKYSSSSSSSIGPSSLDAVRHADDVARQHRHSLTVNISVIYNIVCETMSALSAVFLSVPLSLCVCFLLKFISMVCLHYRNTKLFDSALFSDRFDEDDDDAHTFVMGRNCCCFCRSQIRLNKNKRWSVFCSFFFPFRFSYEFTAYLWRRFVYIRNYWCNDKFWMTKKALFSAEK